jgi:macrolide transport system ATP-binding/permease protein
MGLFTELWSAGGTVIVITHDMTLARRASRVIEVHDGRILKDSASEAA